MFVHAGGFIMLQVITHGVSWHTSNTVISTGITVPTLSCVAALYSLQKAMMLTPCKQVFLIWSHSWFTVQHTGDCHEAKCRLLTLQVEYNCTFAPRAGPTGGAGFALPACSASLIIPVTASEASMNY